MVLVRIAAQEHELPGVAAVVDQRAAVGLRELEMLPVEGCHRIDVVDIDAQVSEAQALSLLTRTVRAGETPARARIPPGTATQNNAPRTRMAPP